MTPAIEDRLREIAFGPNKCVSDAPNHILRNAAREIERLRVALAEQAGLNGMGSEREAEAYRRGVEDAAKVADGAGEMVSTAIAAAIRSLTAPDKEGA